MRRYAVRSIEQVRWQMCRQERLRNALRLAIEMLYYYKEPVMPTHIHQHHHHHPGQGHPPASISPSILRMSAIERLAAAAVVIALIWAAVFWAMA
jgi:hypothetical protein